jgi:hypothetical protein
MPAIVTVTAPVVTQASVTGLPGDGEVGGVAVNEVIFGGGTTVTFTVAVAVTEPTALVAVNVYVVVAAGETSCVPVSETFPSEVILTVVAFSTTHSRVEVWPVMMVDGIAEKRMMRGRVPAMTFTVMLQDAVAEPAPVAVMVYVVVCVGETVTGPLRGAEPLPGLIDTDVALTVW